MGATPEPMAAGRNAVASAQINRTRLAELIDCIGDAAVVEFIRLLETACAEARSAIDAALDADDLDAAAFAAHRVLSPAGNLGADGLFEVARRLEDLARAADRAALEASLSTLDGAARRAVVALRAAITH